MSNDDWYLNRTWNDAVEREFYKKLNRARTHRDHYLYSQAIALKNTRPEVSLQLLDQLTFEQHAIRASVFLAMGKIDKAILFFKKDIEQSKAQPHPTHTNSLAFSYLVAQRRVHKEFAYALSILEDIKDQLQWPLERFQWHASKALITEDPTQAQEALKHAAQDKSGFRYHESLGLVGEEEQFMIKQLQRMCT